MGSVGPVRPHQYFGALLVRVSAQAQSGAAQLVRSLSGTAFIYGVELDQGNEVAVIPGAAWPAGGSVRVGNAEIVERINLLTVKRYE
jgi:hypothetical protein